VQVLADNGGFVLAEDGARLLFLRRRILPAWLPFVLCVVGVIAVGNAIVLTIADAAAGGAVLLLFGFLCGAGVHVVLGSRRRAKAEPLDPGGAIVALDLAAGTLTNGFGGVLAALDQVRIEKAMQVTSSSKSLKAMWPGGSCVVYRGDPFVTKGGSIDVPLAALAQRGVRTG
jgi:hypothetical protein